MPLPHDRLARLADLIDALALQPATQRAGWLATLPPSDADLLPLLQEHLATLAEDDGPEDPEGHGHAPARPAADDTLWRDAPAQARAALARSLAAAEPEPGLRLGPWRLLAPIGRGGMGQVWRAERADGAFQREVALKLPLPSLGPARLAERFARERDILAALAHPHIARLYDAGVAPDGPLAGQPYLVLELVHGAPIGLHADARRLALRARVDLMLQVLAAVQHAHRHLVVHRDLKPSNILVDGDGQVHLLDFGIARLLDDAPDSAAAPLLAATPGGQHLTDAGSAALTPTYAAPEQIRQRQSAGAAAADAGTSARGTTVSTAADIYSAGVVLHELLCGASPYRPAGPGRAALEAAILDDVPLPPSRGVTDAAAAARGLPAPALVKQLRGELDAIVAKACAKAPQDRYAGADALAQDLRRWLAGEPVLALPGTAAYRARKALARHRVAGMAGMLAVLALLTGTALASWQAQRARQEAAHARAVQGFVVDLFDEADPARARGRDLTVRDLMGRAERDLKVQGRGDPALAEQLDATLATIYAKLADFKAAVPLAEARRDLARRLHGEASVEHGDALLALGQAYLGARRRDAALPTLQAAQAVLQGHAAERGEALLQCLLGQAEELYNLQRRPEARALLDGQRARFEQLTGGRQWPWVLWHHRMAMLWSADGDAARAAATLAAVAPLLDRPPADTPYLGPVNVRADQALMLADAGRNAEAAAATQRSIADVDALVGPRNATSATLLGNLAQYRFNAGQFTASGQAYDELLRRTADAEDPRGQTARQNRSAGIRTLLWLGRTDEAVATGRATVSDAEADPQAIPLARRALRRRLALALVVAGQAAEALPMLEALRVAEAKDPPNLRALTLLALAGARQALRRHREAAATAHEAAALWLANAGKAASQVNARLAQHTEVLALAAAGDRAAAQALLDTAAPALREAAGADHPMLAATDMARAALLQAQGRTADARALADTTRARFHDRSGGVMPAEPVVFFL